MNKTIDEYMKKINDIGYKYYFDNKHQVNHKSLNCYDEVCPGSHDRAEKIKGLLNQKILLDENTFHELNKIIIELHGLMREEHMGLTECSEMEANRFINSSVNFNHFKEHVIDGEKYLSVDPIIGPKYAEYNKD